MHIIRDAILHSVNLIWDAHGQLHVQPVLEIVAYDEVPDDQVVPVPVVPPLPQTEPG